jgi:hypothetical protein
MLCVRDTVSLGCCAVLLLSYDEPPSGSTRKPKKLSHRFVSSVRQRVRVLCDYFCATSSGVKGSYLVVLQPLIFFSELYTIVQRLAALRTAMSWECRNGVRWVLDKLVAWDLVQARKIVGGRFFHSG